MSCECEKNIADTAVEGDFIKCVYFNNADDAKKALAGHIVSAITYYMLSYEESCALLEITSEELVALLGGHLELFCFFRLLKIADTLGIETQLTIFYADGVEKVVMDVPSLFVPSACDIPASCTLLNTDNTDEKAE